MNWMIHHNYFAILKPTIKRKAPLARWLSQIEATFTETFPNAITMTGVRKCMIDRLPAFTVTDCTAFPSEYLVKLFVRMGIHYLINKLADQLAEKKGSKKNRRYFKVAHL